MRQIPIILLGVGGVGSGLLRQILAQRDFHAEEYGLHLRILALADSSGAITEPYGGLNDETLAGILAHKQAGKSLRSHELGAPMNDAVDLVDITGLRGTIVVDCSATERTIPALIYALNRQYKVVLANKKPLTADQEAYDRLTRAGVTDQRGNFAGRSTRSLAQSRWETTVGAGLPVIATLNRLVASGDAITRITGTFSGTLGYVMTGLEEGRLFSEIVKEAFALGYTEPDARDDLGGVDVARKALILARGMGWRLDMGDVEVVGLYPPHMDDLSVEAFMAALPTLDASFQEQVAEAEAQESVLRFAATVEDGKCRVGPAFVPADSPLGRLSGTDNLVEITSHWYTPNPLVIQGRGAGVDATAAGVLSDVVELAFT